MRKNLFGTLGWFLGFFILAQMSLAQPPPPPGESATEKYRRERMEQQVRQNVERSFDELRKIGSMTSVGGVRLSAKDRGRLIRASEEEALAGEVGRLRPAESYFRQFADFLEDDDTGLARLFPDMRCDQGRTVNVGELERCADSLPIRGGGSFYSFRNRTNLNERGAWADIHFIDDRLTVGGRTEFGLIRELGDVELAGLSLRSAELEFLRKYKPENRVSEVELEKQKLENGLLGGFASNVPVKLNTTYLLRSVAYRQEISDWLDKRADVIVAFRIVGREADGSLVLLWRELKSREAPKLKSD